jgi:hypothetical protein
MRGLVLVGLVGCYGAGPAPIVPPDVEVVFSGVAPTGPCETGRYIGSLAIDDAGTGYAAMLPYVTRRTCKAHSIVPTIVANVVRFDGTTIGTAGRSDGYATRPQVAVARAGGDPRWTYQSEQTHLELHVNKPMESGGILAEENPFHILHVAGIALHGTDTYVAARTVLDPGSDAVELPDFPLPGGSGIIGDEAWVFSNVAADGRLVPLTTHVNSINNMRESPHWFCEQANDCLIATANGLVYLAVDGIAYVGMHRYGAADEHVLANVPLILGTTLSGLGADDAHVAWSSSSLFAQLRGAGECHIAWHDISGALPTPATPAQKLLDSDRFACRDLEVVGNDVYFAIVEIREVVPAGYERYLHGTGVGRVRVNPLGPPHEVETLDLGVSGLAAGPRRIYVRGDQLYLADPFTVVRVPTSALDGAKDLLP